jgi:hypothetical protein
MLRTSHHMHGITHVIFGVIDVCWLVALLYQTTDIDTSEEPTTVIQYSRIYTYRYSLVSISVI